MGNSIRRAGKVILSDGSVQEFEQPLSVAELMLDHPQHLVAEFKAGGNGRPAPLPADETLHTNKVYVMIPLTREWKANEAQRIVFKSGFLSSSPYILPLLSCMCPMGKRGREFRRIDKVEEKSGGAEAASSSSSSSVLMLEGLDESPEYLNTQRPEYLNTQMSGKGWKPTLDTITESAIEKKISHWLFRVQ